MDNSSATFELQNVKFGIQKVRNSRYVFEYKNVWDPVKKRSKPLYRISAGKILGDTIIINEDYLSRFPELQQGDLVLEDGKVVYRPVLPDPSRLFKVRDIDHFVLITEKPAEMLAFYKLLGLRIEEEPHRFVVWMPSAKINIHVKDHPLLPEAIHPTPGSGDFCLEIQTESSLDEIANLFKRNHVDVQGPCVRHGARGKMNSIYLRDPDGNLVELSVYG